jgi:subtilisin family serine protease
MAAPYVSAVAALLMAEGRTPQQAIDAIQQTARNTSRNPKLGLGIVDAAAAVKWKPSQGETGTAPPPKKNPANPAQRQKHRRKRR